MAQLRQIIELEGIVAEDSALALLAEAGDGSMRDALSIMDQAIASAPVVEGKAKLEADPIRELMGTVPNPVFEKLLEEVHGNQSAAVIEQINGLINAGNSPSQLARQLVRYLRNTLMAKLGGETTELLQISADERARAARSAALFSEEDLTRFLQVMLRTFDELNYRQEQRFHLELGLLKLVHLQRLLPLEQILSSLPGSSGPATPPTMPPTTLPRQSPPRSAPNAAAAVSAVPQASATTSPTSPTESGPAERASGPIPPLDPHPADPLDSHPVDPHPDPLGPSGSNAVDPKSVASQPADLERFNLDQARDAVVAALGSGGHNTAAALLSAGRWTLQNDGSIQVEVGVKKTMLSLTMNAQAWKLTREALAAIGIQEKLTVVPGEMTGDATRAPRPAVSGSIQAVALENPLVRQAQELFRAEVLSVVDLRESPQQVSRNNQ
jgi:DNA polymerase-3 subunit gamma/tau